MKEKKIDMAAFICVIMDEFIHMMYCVRRKSVIKKKKGI